MSTIKFAINNVQPNPFQTRQSEDADHIKEIAQSIGARGIMQNPMGRMSATQSGQAEIAFGHTRLAALKLLTMATQEELAELGFTFATPAEYQTFIEKNSTIEIDIQTLSDVEMFEMAVAENHDRKDLNTLEEAKAMIVYKDTFGKNSDEIGLLFHLSGSAVRNKMRLLDLPEQYKPLMESGEVTEGIGRELLALYDLPTQLRDHETYDYSNGGRIPLTKSIYLQISKGNLKLDELKKLVSQAITGYTEELDKKPFKHDEVLLDAESKELPICKGCSNHLKRANKELCMNPECFNAKVIAWKTAYLQQASLLTGIPVLEHTNGDFKSHTRFIWGNEQSLKTIQARGGCENLRLVYSESDREATSKDTNLVGQGFPKAMICCMKKEGYCTCIKAEKAGVEMTPKEGDQVSEAQLKEARAKMNASKLADKAVVADLKLAFAEALKKGLDGKNMSLYVFLLENADYGYFNIHSKTIPESLERLYSNLCDLIPNHKLSDGESRGILHSINYYLKEIGLDPLGVTLPEATPENKSAEDSLEDDDIEDESAEDEEEDDLQYDNEEEEEDQEVREEIEDDFVPELPVIEEARANLDDALLEMQEF